MKSLLTFGLEVSVSHSPMIELVSQGLLEGTIYLLSCAMLRAVEVLEG